MDYKILFEESATYEFKFKVLDTLIKLYNQGCSNLGVVAELNLAVCLRNDEEKTATFTYIGF